MWSAAKRELVNKTRQFYFLKEISKNTKVSGPRTDIDSVTTKNVVIFLEYQLT